MSEIKSYFDKEAGVSKGVKVSYIDFAQSLPPVLYEEVLGNKGYEVIEYKPIWNKYDNSKVYSKNGRQGAKGYTLKKAYKKYLDGKLTTSTYDELKKMSEESEIQKEASEHAGTFEKIQEGEIKTPQDLGDSIAQEHHKEESCETCSHENKLPGYLIPFNDIISGKKYMIDLSLRRSQNKAFSDSGAIHAVRNSIEGIKTNNFNDVVNKFRELYIISSDDWKTALKLGLSIKSQEKEGGFSDAPYVFNSDLAIRIRNAGINFIDPIVDEIISGIYLESTPESFSDCLTRNGINLEKENHRFEVGTKIKDNIAGTMAKVQEIRENDVLLSYMSALGHGEPVRFNVDYSKLIETFAAGEISVDGFEKDEKMEFARVLNTVQHCMKMDKLASENEELKIKNEKLNKKIPEPKFEIGEKVLYTPKLSGFDNSKPLTISYRNYREADPSSFVEEGWSYQFKENSLASYEKNLEKYKGKSERSKSGHERIVEEISSADLSAISDKKLESNLDMVQIQIQAASESKNTKALEKLRAMETGIINERMRRLDVEETISGLKTLLSLTADKEEKKRIRKEIEEIENQEAYSYIEKGKAYSDAVDIADEKLKKVIAGNRGPSGLVNDKTKSSEEYKKAKKEYDKAFSTYRDFNKSFSNKIKSKAAEIRRNEKINKNKK